MMSALAQVIPMLLLSAAQVQPPPTYWGGLAAGPHAVGFRQQWLVDSTRRLPPGPGTGPRFRPVLLNLWYPTDAGAGPAMPYADYFAGVIRAAGRDTALRAYATALVGYNRNVSRGELAGTEPDSIPLDVRSRIDALFQARTAARRDARLPARRLPVVIYTQGSRSSFDDNVVLCEYLASRGYLVIGSAFPREDNSAFSTSASDESRQRDIRRLVVEVTRMFGAGPVAVVGHSAGAQAMQLFAADPSAPIDAVLSLDTTQDYAMLSDETWAYYTGTVLDRRDQVRVPIVFVAGRDALFELADSLSASPRWLVTVDSLRHSEYISQGNMRNALKAGLSGDDPVRREAARRAYAELVGYLGAWLDEWGKAGPAPVAGPRLEVVAVRPGAGTPRHGDTGPRTAREVRHLFGSASAADFADVLAPLRKSQAPWASDAVVMMLVVHAIRLGDADRARAAYRELLSRDPGTARVRALIEDRAKLFEQVGAPELVREWRGFLAALDGTPAQEPGAVATQPSVANSVWSVDLMKTKPGQLERYLRYLDANWARARRTAVALGQVLSFEVLVASDSTAAGAWDVMLITEWPDSAAYAQRERTFQPILAAQGQTLIDGLSGRGPDNPLKRTVGGSMVLTNPIGSLARPSRIPR